MNAKHSKRQSDQVIKTSSTSFHTSSVKIWSPQRMLTNDIAVFVCRVRCNAQFATVSSCTRRFFKYFNFKFWQTTFDIPNSDEFLSLVKFDVWFYDSWCTFLTRNCLLTESTLSSVPTASPLPWRFHDLLPVFLNFLNSLLRPETVQPLPENSVISFCTIILQFVQMLN